MGLIVRVVLVVAGAIASLFVARDAANFELVAGIVGVAVIAAVVLLIALTRRG